MTRRLLGRAAPVAIALAIAWGPPASPAETTRESAAPRPPRAEVVAAMQASLARIRGHEYRKPVVIEMLSEAEVAAYLKRKLDKEYPASAIADEQTAYVHFGLLGRSEDLESLFLGLLTEQAAGFYDPEEKRLFVVTGKPFPGVALVHELAHALQDQMFDVGPLLEKAKGSDDRFRAVQAMIEGEAMELSTAHVVSHPDQAGLLDGSLGDGGEEASMADALAGSLEALKRFPDVLQADLLFPYTEGMKWATAMSRSGGRSLMDAIYKDPPESTEQILHPEKTIAPRDRPSSIDEDLIPDLTASGYRPVKVNTWGEFSIRQLLGGEGSQDAVAAATGWDGDLYGVFERKDGATAMIWISAWDSPGDAMEFAGAIEGWLGRRHPDAGSFAVRNGGPEGRIVSILEGFEAPLAASLAETIAARLARHVSLR